MYIKALSGLFVCCTLLSAAESGVVITDAAPTEFPNIVKIMFQDSALKKFVPGVFVSAKYVLTFLSTQSSLTKDSFQVTDQLGAVHTVGALGDQSVAYFRYMKICTAFKGTPLNMSESSFDALASSIDAQMFFF
ncbi:uncharacterized protein LOC135941187 [Cloeon dipterum]|uniref:uncharacterized protein LOC135941187 n=1 Tax=Cloeon dipterum TaxID=197152 RepID=UPI00321FCB97